MAGETVLSAELAQARRELRCKVTQARNGIAALAVGLAVVLIGLQALAAGAVLGLAPLLGGWLAALTVGAAAVLGGFALIRGGTVLLRPSRLRPGRTIASLRRAGAWLRSGPASETRGNQWSTGNGT